MQEHDTFPISHSSNKSQIACSLILDRLAHASPSQTESSTTDEQMAGWVMASHLALDPSFEDDQFFNGSEWETIVKTWPTDADILDVVSVPGAHTPINGKSIDTGTQTLAEAHVNDTKYEATGSGDASANPLPNNVASGDHAEPAKLFLAFCLPTQGTEQDSADQFTILAPRDELRGVTIERNGWKVTL